ncbi:MAG: hypothetical protein FWF49_06275 [Oscillospiraceae bacterium]|nr:hypothetical protein [Oscillospiraceae bacterium]
MLWPADKRTLDFCRDDLFKVFFDEFNNASLLNVFNRQSKSEILPEQWQNTLLFVLREAYRAGFDDAVYVLTDYDPV